MAAVAPDRFLLAQAELKAELLSDPDPDRWGQGIVASVMPWQPVVDGVVVPAPPIERIAAGSARHVDVMAGTNTDDWRLWLVVGGAIGQITEEILRGPVSTYGYQSLAAYGLAPDAALSAYRARYPDASPGDLLASVQTDWWMRIPAIRLADAHADTRAQGDGAATSATFMYEFAWPSPGLGAVHALEVPFVFDTARTDAPLFGSLLGSDPPQDLARTMHAAWVAFATTGDPDWPAYDGVRRATMRFDLASRLVEDPRTWERAFWEGLR
jgi:carboxylesterase type B